MARIQFQRSIALSEFYESLNENKAEDYWQDFFSKNQWIFGYGLKYFFLTQLTEQPYYGGMSFTRLGAQKGDFLLNTEAEIKFTVLVEIKCSSTNLLAVYNRGANKSENYKYRNGAYLLSRELIGGVSQLQINCKTWLRNCLNQENYEKLSKQNIYTVCPKGILLIGNTKELESDREKIETFQTYRNCITNPEIITFDELYQRAKYIVERDNDQEDNIISEPDEDDLPF